ncbi:hypothetical protein [Halomonas sp.]|uniref:hypothetical protein n=1 Tax=Halomonas sp. TaxID=1486246 RepID=UPI003568C1D9
MARTKLDYTHGDVGAKPPGSLNFEQNERPDAQQFDWWWDAVSQALADHADEFTRLDSNDDGIVDQADEADTVDGQHAADFAAAGHLHDGRYYTETEADSNFSPSGHDHDDRYYTETEVDTNFADVGHLHDGRYYRETETLRPNALVLPVGSDQWA